MSKEHKNLSRSDLYKNSEAVNDSTSLYKNLSGSFSRSDLYKNYKDLNIDFPDTSNIINQYLGCQAITNDGKLCNLKYEFKIDDIDNDCELYCVNHIYNWIQKLFDEKYYILKNPDGVSSASLFLKTSNKKKLEFKIDEIIIKSKTNILNINNKTSNIENQIKNFINNNKIYEILLFNNKNYNDFTEIIVFNENFFDNGWYITNNDIKKINTSFNFNIQGGKGVKQILYKKIFDIYEYYIKKNIYKFNKTNSLENDINNFYNNNFVNILDDKLKFEFIFNKLKYELIKFDYIYYIVSESDVFLDIYESLSDEYDDSELEIIKDAYLLYTNQGFYNSMYVNNIIPKNNNYIIVYCDEDNTKIYKKILQFNELKNWLKKKEIIFYDTYTGIKIMDEQDIELPFAIFCL